MLAAFLVSTTGGSTAEPSPLKVRVVIWALYLFEVASLYLVPAAWFAAGTAIVKIGVFFHPSFQGHPPTATSFGVELYGNICRCVGAGVHSNFFYGKTGSKFHVSLTFVIFT